MTRGRPLVPARRRRAPAIRPDVHDRFLVIVQRGQERADREEREHLAAIRGTRQTRRGPQPVALRAKRKALR